MLLTWHEVCHFILMRRRWSRYCLWYSCRQVKNGDLLLEPCVIASDLPSTSCPTSEWSSSHWVLDDQLLVIELILHVEIKVGVVCPRHSLSSAVRKNSMAGWHLTRPSEHWLIESFRMELNANLFLCVFCYVGNCLHLYRDGPKVINAKENAVSQGIWNKVQLS